MSGFAVKCSKTTVMSVFFSAEVKLTAKRLIVMLKVISFFISKSLCFLLFCFVHFVLLFQIKV